MKNKLAADISERLQRRWQPPDEACQEPKVVPRLRNGPKAQLYLGA